jgi:hypothetical protein
MMKKSLPSNVLDIGGYEMGFNPATQSCRERDILDLDCIPPPQVLRTMHDRQMPHTQLGAHSFVRPTRHAPWKSEAERVMLASEMSMSANMSRLNSQRSDGSRRSPSPPSGGGERPRTSSSLPFSPVHVGRPGTSDFKMQNSRLYAKVANSVDRKNITLRGDNDDDRSVSSSMSTASSIPKPAPSPQLKHLTSDMNGSIPETRSPYARFDLISQQFTNPVVQDLWIEVKYIKFFVC